MRYATPSYEETLTPHRQPPFAYRHQICPVAFSYITREGRRHERHERHDAAEQELPWQRCEVLVDQGKVGVHGLNLAPYFFFHKAFGSTLSLQASQQNFTTLPSSSVAMLLQ